MCGMEVSWRRSRRAWLSSTEDPYICPVGVGRPERRLECLIASRVETFMAGLIGETSKGRGLTVGA